MAELLSMGELLIDFAPSGETEDGRLLFARNPGGAPANVAVQAHRAGVSAGFLGCVGDDMFGNFLRGTLEGCGVETKGLSLVSGGTDNHLMLVDLRPFDITGKELEHRLDEVYITVNKNAIPNDPQKPFVTSGLRIGTPAVTTRGLKEEEMEKIAEYIYLAAKDFDNKADFIREGVTEICTKYPLYE